MIQKQNIITDDLVQRVNELYHDITNEQYRQVHPEIFVQEKERWVRTAKRFIRQSKIITIADIGTGTGFVPISIKKNLKNEDTLICTDISQKILDTAKRNIDEEKVDCHCHFKKIERQVPLKLPIKNNSIDVVTINSVLHHVHDTENFLNEVDRVLKPNGLLFIAHEPNSEFYNNYFLKYNYILLNNVLDPKQFTGKILKKIGLEKQVKRIYYRVSTTNSDYDNEQNKIADNINDILIKEKLIETRLTPVDIGNIVDIKVSEGFQPETLLRNYDILHLETYNHISSVSINYYHNKNIRKYDNYLRKKYPEEGATFFIVLQKSHKTPK